MKFSLLFISFLILISTLNADKKHLLILAGQSNMFHLDEKTSFTPFVEKAFGKENISIVKNAKRGAPIINWDKDYKVPEGATEIKKKRAGKETSEEDVKEPGSMYEKLMQSIKKEGKEFKSVTFLWMQGETDAGKKLTSVYMESLERVINRLKNDLKVDSINIVIGRLSDYGLKNPEWVKLRELQVKYADDNANVEWVNTDDLNDKVMPDGTNVNDLHYTEEGYKIFGQRLAEKTILLLNKKKQ